MLFVHADSVHHLPNPSWPYQLASFSLFTYHASKFVGYASALPASTHIPTFLERRYGGVKLGSERLNSSISPHRCRPSQSALLYLIGHLIPPPNIPPVSPSSYPSSPL
ncbi:hypothetical protein BDN67DRAFT_760715 [Paxillus ammoniavirescens]|nr:hypothetical protein BDN67DRAFT_760715 [Paxillus ammoniavirescens]